MPSSSRLGSSISESYHEEDGWAALQALQEHRQHRHRACHSAELCMVADVSHSVWAQGVIKWHSHDGVGHACTLHKHPICNPENAASIRPAQLARKVPLQDEDMREETPQ